MSLSEREVYEAFGLEMPEKAESEPGTASTAEQTQTQQEGQDAGANEQEVAEPAQGAESAETGDDQQPQTQEKAQPEQPDAMPPEQRRQNAARRRKKELDNAINAAIAKERAAADERMQALLKSAGIKSPYTGEVISSVEELKEYLASDRQKRIERDLKAGKLTMEALQEAARTALPEKQEPKEEQPDPQPEDGADTAVFQTQVQSELAEIAKLNPKVKSINDILQMETGQRFAQLVQNNGLSFLDAYKLANEDAIRQQTAAAAAQAAKTAAATKQHLQASTKRGAGAVTVPTGEMQVYRALFPHASDAEIQKMYNDRIGKRKE